MRIAIIDLGTNSVRFDIHQLGPGKTSKLLHREKIMIRLGQGVFTKGQLNHHAILRTTHVFLTFKRIMKKYSVNRVIAFATSALREAKDAKKFITHIKKITGIQVRVISGVKEARLIALGIINNQNIANGKIGLIDIGGGSTEMSIIKNKKIHFCASFPLGTARLQQVFLKKSPPASGNIKKLRFYIQKTLSHKLKRRKSIKVIHMIGSSGTVRALVRMIKKTSRRRSAHLDQIHALVKQMRHMTTTQLLDIPGMEAKRVDMILAGSVLLEECMHVLGAKQIHSTKYALRDGILCEQLKH